MSSLLEYILSLFRCSCEEDNNEAGSVDEVVVMSADSDREKPSSGGDCSAVSAGLSAGSAGLSIQEDVVFPETPVLTNNDLTWGSQFTGPPSVSSWPTLLSMEYTDPETDPEVSIELATAPLVRARVIPKPQPRISGLSEILEKFDMDEMIEVPELTLVEPEMQVAPGNAVDLDLETGDTGLQGEEAGGCLQEGSAGASKEPPPLDNLDLTGDAQREST